MKMHVRLALVSIALSLAFVGFWTGRVIYEHGAIEIVHLPSSWKWAIVSSGLIFISGEFAYNVSASRTFSRIVRWLCFAGSAYLLFHLAWLIDLSFSIWEAKPSRLITPITNGAPSHLRWVVCSVWSFLAVTTVWMVARRK